MPNTPRDAYHDLIIVSNPVGYWPLRENTLDESGHGRDGVCVGSPEFVQNETV